jgi:hypothetical protein
VEIVDRHLLYMASQMASSPSAYDGLNYSVEEEDVQLRTIKANGFPLKRALPRTYSPKFDLKVDSDS